MKILITAGTGVISEGLVRASIERGYKTYTFTRGTHPERNVKGAVNFFGNVHDINCIKNNIRDMNFDVVIECLGMNVKDMQVSLEAFGKICKHYIYVSSAGVYLRDGSERYITEESELEGHGWDVMHNKVKCEQFLIRYAQKHGISYTIIRPTVIYGPYRVPYPIVSRKNPWTIFQRILNDEPIVAFERSDIKFSIMHIDDFSAVVMELCLNKKAEGQIFNISSNDEIITWDEVIYSSARILNKDVDIIHIPLELYRYTFYDLYDELKWNKVLPFVFDSKKVIEAIHGYKNFIKMDKGMVDCISNLEEQYRTVNQYLDNEYNYASDMIIWLALRKKKLIEEEAGKAEKYFKSKSFKEKMKLQFWYWKVCMSKPLYKRYIQIKHKVKMLIMKILKKEN